MINVEETEEFQQWAKNKAEGTRYHYKASLQKFCNFHEMTPSQLLEEAYEKKKKSKKPWLDSNPADQRLQEWYSHLVKSENKGGQGVAKNTAQTYWRHIKAFYQKFNVEITVETPKAPTHTNDQPEYTASEVRKIVDGARTLRDRALIICGFQGAMLPKEICRLNYEGGLKEAIEKGKHPYLISKVRKKTEVKHHTPLFKDAIEALQMYINKRKREGKLKEDENGNIPLFVKENGERLEPRNIRFMMRKVKDRVIDQIPKAKNLDSDINPFSFKYLRKSFGWICESKAKVDDNYKEYWLGHNDRYNKAYSGKIAKEDQLEELEKLEPYLSITAPHEELEEVRKQKDKEQDKRIAQLEEEKVELREKLEDQGEILNETKEYLEKEFERQIALLTNELRTNLGFSFSGLKEIAENKEQKKAISIIEKQHKKLVKEIDKAMDEKPKTKKESKKEVEKLTEKGALGIPDLSFLSLTQKRKLRDNLESQKGVTEIVIEEAKRLGMKPEELSKEMAEELDSFPR